MRSWQVPVAEPWIGEEEVRAVALAVKEGWVARGPAIEEFENTFARWLGVKHAVAVSSGTAAVEVALRVLDLEGREVLTTVHSCAATLLGMLHGGVQPRFVDIRLSDYNADPDQIGSHITPSTAAILVVHCYGRASDMGRIRSIADRYGLPVIEDCAMALGARVSGHAVGTLGTIGCFSFYGNKIITTGEGGMVVTNDETFARKARVIRNYGQEPGRPFLHVEYGYNFKMSNIHAAIGLAQLGRLEESLRRRRENARTLTRLLAEVESVRLPPACSEEENAYFCYPLLTESKERDRVCRQLEAMGIETRVMFPSLVTQPFYERRYGPADALYPVADYVAANGFYVGCSPTLTAEALEYLATAIRTAVQDKR